MAIAGSTITGATISGSSWTVIVVVAPTRPTTFDTPGTWRDFHRVTSLRLKLHNRRLKKDRR